MSTFKKHKKGGLTSMEINGRFEFLQAIFLFFRVNDEGGTLFKTYEVALTCKFPVNWQELYLYVIQKVETKTLPLPKFFVDLLPKFEKRPIEYTADEGSTVRVEFYNGLFYDFYITSNAKSSISDVFQKHKRSIKSIVHYPKGVLLINNQLCFDTDDKLEKLKLEKNIKVLYEG